MLFCCTITQIDLNTRSHLPMCLSSKCFLLNINTPVQLRIRACKLEQRRTEPPTSCLVQPPQCHLSVLLSQHGSFLHFIRPSSHLSIFNKQLDPHLWHLHLGSCSRGVALAALIANNAQLWARHSDAIHFQVLVDSTGQLLCTP